MSKFFAPIGLFSLLVNGQVLGMSEKEPLQSMLKIDQLEWRDADDSGVLYVEGEAWLGYDLNKFWLKTELERSSGATEEAELQALYSRAVAPYWDLQVGVRQDFLPKPERSWGVIGFKGLAPYWFEVDTALFVGESGRVALRLEVEYEILLTQRLILSPEVELNLHGQNDRATGAGSGLSDVELGLQLRYEIRREIAPYIGIHWFKKFGNTADFLREEGANVSDAEIVLGIRLWF